MSKLIANIRHLTAKEADHVTVDYVVEEATDRFKYIETWLDAHVRQLRDLERKHPEIAGYEFDDLVRSIEDFSDEVRQMPEWIVE